MADADRVTMDAIVVGGGPAGLAAAHTMAKAGLEVMLVERGETCGAKNVGGLVYGTVLNEMIPNAFEQAPVERPVSKRTMVFLGGQEHVALDFGADEWSRPPYNHTYVVHRSQFDRWFAKQAEVAGANLLEGMVVEDLIYEESGGVRRAVGVRIRGDEEFYAGAVVLADGANCLVTDKARAALGMKGGAVKQDFAIGVKEILSLPKGVIEDRFQLDPGEGAAMDFFGVPFEGIIGGGFLYTAREAIHLGFAARISSITAAGLKPGDVLDQLKRHPVVRKLVRGAELVEYSAHMIPEGGYDAVGQLAGDGVMIAGDAAGFVNMSAYKEGTNHAMESGRAAGLTAIEAKKTGDFSRAGLAGYERRLADGVVLKDLKRYRKVPHVLEECPNLLSLYPKKVNRMLVDMFTCAPESKKETQKKAFRTFMHGLPKFRFVRDVLRARHLA
jgi:electron transfer flavoprotein-quinone oxidoreductase